MSDPGEFEALFADALHAVVVIDDTRVITGINAAGYRLLGAETHEIIGRPLDELLERPANVDAAWHKFLRNGHDTGRLRLVRPGGTPRTVAYTAVAHFTRSRHLAVLREIGRHAGAQEARRARLQRETRLRETETLLAVSRTLSETLDPTETMRRVAREIAHTLEADMVGAYLADPDQHALWPVAGYRVPREMLAAFQQHPIPITNHPAIQEAWTHGRAVWTDDMPRDARVDPETYARFPHQSDLFAPISIKGRPVGGFFVIWWRERRTFTADEQRLLQGISDLAGIFLEAAQLYREAAEANRAKDEFLATLSHELRNPLGAIANAAAALGRPRVTDEIAGRLREIIQRQTNHLARLIDDLLEVAQVTAGKITLHRQRLALGDVVRRAVRALQDSGRGHEHHVALDVDPVMVNADPTRLEQIVTNLVDNAIKYTPAGGAIRIEVRQDGDRAVLRVTDSGMGIAPDALPRVFELFAQGDQPLDRALGGLGIGLALSRRLVELHGGSIEAASEGSGRGARFTIRLPVDQTAPRTMPVAPARVAANRTILVVEDNDDSREALRFLLGSLGHRVFEAADGRQGLALALELRPDIMLVDLGLPGLDGYALARALRADPAVKTVRLVAVTGYGQADDRRRSTEAGFDAHLVKPVSVPALLSLLGPETGSPGPGSGEQPSPR